MSVQRLSARDVGLRRDRGKVILDAIDLEATAGTVTLVAGPTGAGKSTLLYLLGGMLRPSQGEILADGEAVSRWTAAHRDRWRRRVGFLFQHAELIGDLSAADNVTLPLIPRSGSLVAKGAIVRRTLAALRIDALATQAARELSGGERQRVALARALVGEPEILLLDEPTAHQDDDAAELILTAIRHGRERGAVIVIASHDRRALNAALADRTVFLTGGRLQTPDDGAEATAR